MKAPAQIALSCSAHPEVREIYEFAVRRVGAPRLSWRIIGFTEKIDEWIKKSTLLIGKPGGLTLSEAMACGVPIVIFQPIPGQEERKSDHLLEAASAIKWNNITTIA